MGNEVWESIRFWRGTDGIYETLEIRGWRIWTASMLKWWSLWSSHDQRILLSGKLSGFPSMIQSASHTSFRHHCLRAAQISYVFLSSHHESRSCFVPVSSVMGAVQTALVTSCLSLLVLKSSQISSPEPECFPNHIPLSYVYEFFPDLTPSTPKG